MLTGSAIDQSQFRRILARNIAMPLVTGLVNATLFLVLIFYLLSSFKVIEHAENVLRTSNDVIKLSVDMQTGLRGYLITGDEAFLAPRRSAKPKFAAEMANLQQLVDGDTLQLERLDRIQVMLDQWEEYAETVIGLRDNDEDISSLVASRGTQEFNAIRTEFYDFQDMERQQLQEYSARTRTIALSAIAAYLLISFGLAGLLSYLGRRELLLLSTTYSRSLAELQENADILERQAWQRTGQADLAEQCIGKTALNDLGRTVLDVMAHRLDASVGAMYVRDSAGKLRQVATYGGAEEQGSEATFNQQAGGLVEQAAYSRRLLQLDDLPPDYLKISSGLGSSPPRHLLLMPLCHEGQVNGVIELGLLRPPANRHLEFLELVAPSIGDTVEMSLQRRRMQDMLEETQQLNEELQTQQEELRCTNEELEEQSQVLQRSQALLENQKEELQQSNDKLMDQALILDQKNTALNQIQAELEERAADLQRASKYKSEFLANMSHELRTPLNSSMILAKLLAENQKGNLDEEQVRFAQSIYSSGNDLLDLINDILDISKVEAGKLDLTVEPVPVQQLVEALKMTFVPLAGQKQLQFSAELAQEAPPMITTDYQRVEQILKNLLSNAIKFTDRGEVSLAVAAGDSGWVEFRVKDSGIGIAADQQKIIFEAFQQADGSINRRFGGTGLGLSISRDLAALLGGTIRVESAPGKGSVFTLYLPVDSSPVEQAALAPSPVPAPASPPAMKKEKVNSSVPESASDRAFADDRTAHSHNKRTLLVVEDDLDFARVLYGLAHELGYQCLVAPTAGEGLELANHYQPDAILLDLGLPDASGMSVLHKLKSNSLTRHIPVHIASATDRAEAALQLGAIGYAVKPASLDQLKQVFSKLEEKFTQKTKRVLLVEDDANQRQAVVHLIGDKDVNITAVETGAEALNLLRNHIYDCMIIDLKLPDMEGHQLLQHMSTEELVAFPPVIVYTGRNLTRAEEHELLKYSRSIIIKGARSPERLLDEVTLFLHKVEAELTDERQRMLRTVRSRDKALDGRRVLLVDDDARNVFALTGALEQKGAVVEIARNGYEALEKLDSVPEIDLVLMDIMMPGMDGLEATRRIRADGRFAKLPIIAVTAKAMKDDQEQCMRAGASDYLAKPIDLDRLYSLLRVWLPGLERLA